MRRRERRGGEEGERGSWEDGNSVGVTCLYQFLISSCRDMARYSRHIGCVWSVWSFRGFGVFMMRQNIKGFGLGFGIGIGMK